VVVAVVVVVVVVVVVAAAAATVLPMVTGNPGTPQRPCECRENLALSVRRTYHHGAAAILGHRFLCLSWRVSQRRAHLEVVASAVMRVSVVGSLEGMEVVGD
jgi:hypothetical protein